MSNLFVTEANAKPLNPQIGTYNGKKKVTVDFEILDGEHAGKRASYSGKLDPDNIKFTKRDMIALGWQGKDASTFAADVKAANKAVPITTRIAEHNGRQWTSVDRINGAGVDLKEFDGDQLREVNQLFASVGDEAGDGGQPVDDLPF